MTSGLKGRIFGFKPYSATVKTIGNRLRLATYRVEVRDGAICLVT